MFFFKSSLNLLALTLLMVMFMSCTPRESYQSYKTLNQFQMPSPKSKVVELEHKKSGAHIVLIKNSDPAKAFTAAFRTPPYDNSGLFHIFEHSVLDGSRLYPSKSNFSNLFNSSVSSFMNAMTSSVSTFYPFVSKDTKDFENLLSFYMDAVYFPKKDPRIIKREGWRYEVDPKTKKMSINGVVFSEMKGVFSNPYSVLDLELNRNLLPQTPYSFESGGLPEKISNLSYEQIVQAHEKYYHPQNSLIFLYGDIDYKKTLSKIDKEFLNHFTKNPDFPIPPIPLQKNLNYPKSVAKVTYPGPAKGQNKDFLIKAYTLGPLKSLERDVAHILIRAFVSKTSSPLKLRILKEGLARTVFTQPFGDQNNGYGFVFEGTEIENREKIEKVIQEEMDKISKEGFDPELLTSILNKYEFDYKSKFSNGAMLGYSLMYSVKNYWLFKEEPLEKSLDFMGSMKDLRKKLNDTGFVKSFFEKHFSKSSRFRWLAMEPDPLFSQKFNSGIEKQIQSALKLKPLSEYEKEDIDFRKWVAEKEPPQVTDKIPHLKLSDIKPDEAPIAFHQSKMDSTEVIQYPQQTSGISTIKLFFDLKGVKEENLKKLNFFTSFLKKTNTKNYSFKQISKLIDIHTGGIGFYINPYQSMKEPQKFKPILVVSLKFLDQNLDKSMELLNELLANSEFTPEDRVEKLVNEMKTDMANGLSFRAPSLASLAVRKSFYPALGGFLDEMDGGSFEKFILDLKVNPKELTMDLKSILKNVFNQDRLHLVTMTSRNEKLKELKTKLEKFRNSLPKTGLENQNWFFKNQKSYNAFFIPGEVQYVYQGASFKEAGLDYSGTMEVLSKVLNLRYMTPKLREQAGAYGGGSYFSKNGLSIMYSYRDPNLKKTFETFSRAMDFIKNEKINQKVLTPLILGSLKPYYRDKSIQEKTDFMTTLYLTDQSWDDYINTKKEILTTKPEDLKKISTRLSRVFKKSRKAVAGNPDKLKKEAPFLKEVLSFQ